MEITEAQFAVIKPYLPRQRGNVVHQSLEIINAILWLAENDCKWAGLPSRFGDSHTIYVRVNRWNKAGVLDRLFEQMQRLQLIRLKLEVAGGSERTLTGGPTGAPSAVSMDLTSELPKFAWVPRIRVCHRRLEAARRRNSKTQRVGKRGTKAETARPIPALTASRA